MTGRTNCDISIAPSSALWRGRPVSIIASSMQNLLSEPVAGSIKRPLRNWRGALGCEKCDEIQDLTAAGRELSPHKKAVIGQSG